MKAKTINERNARFWNRRSRVTAAIGAKGSKGVATAAKRAARSGTANDAELRSLMALQRDPVTGVAIPPNPEGVKRVKQLLRDGDIATAMRSARLQGRKRVRQALIERLTHGKDIKRRAHAMARELAQSLPRPPTLDQLAEKIGPVIGLSDDRTRTLLVGWNKKK
jgi:hypothetical protein